MEKARKCDSFHRYCICIFGSLVEDVHVVDVLSQCLNIIGLFRKKFAIFVLDQFYFPSSCPVRVAVL